MYLFVTRHVAKALIIGMAVSLLVGGCNNEELARQEKLQKITVGSVPAIVEAPTHVAYDCGHFKENGLDVNLVINPDGKTSLENLFDGKADIVHVMATPIVYAGFDRDDFYVIGKIKHPKIHSAIGRKDRGIREASDLKGKRIAVTKGTSGEFFMDSYFLYNDIEPSEAEIVYMDAPTMVEAIAKGEVDALFCWAPFPLMAKNRLEANGVELDSGNIVPASWLIAVKKDFARRHPDILKRYLRSLLEAEGFVRENREEAIQIHARIGGVNPDIVSQLLDGMEWNLCLDQAILNDLEDQARWIIRYGYTDKTQVPDYLDLIHPEPLKEIKPEVVSVIK